MIIDNSFPRSEMVLAKGKKQQNIQDLSLYSKAESRHGKVIYIKEKTI
jgi:hypothetical protein